MKKLFLLFSVCLVVLLLGTSVSWSSAVLLPEDNAETKDTEPGFWSFLPKLLPTGKNSKSDNAATSTTTTTTETTGASNSASVLTPAQRDIANRLSSGTFLKETGKTGSRKSRPSRLDTPEMQARIQAIRKAKEQMRARPPVILEPTEFDPGELNIASQGNDSSLLLTVSDKYAWGEREVLIIYKSLGYKPEELAQKCQVRFMVNMKTSDNTFVGMKHLYSGEQKNIDYRGDVTSLSFKPYAVCLEPSSLPQRGSVLWRAGKGLLMVQLTQNASCTPPDMLKKPTRLDMQYLGGGKATCKFQ